MANFKVALTVWFTVQLPYCYTWYLPTSPSVEYCNTTRQDSSCETELPVFVNRLDSNKRYIPYKYDGFGFVKLPSKSNIKENIGELLQGDRLHKSPYNMTFLTAGSCMMGDTWQTTYTRNTNMWAHLKEAIMLNYQHHWYIDDVPVLWCYQTRTSDNYCSPMFPVGCYVTPSGQQQDACVIDPKFNRPDTYYLFNHLEFVITYSVIDDIKHDGEIHGNIIKVTVNPYSINHDATGITSCNLDNAAMEFAPNFTEILVKYSYTVIYQEEKDVKWSHRWNYVMDSLNHNNLNLFSIMNSGLITAFFTGGITILSYKVKASRNKNEESSGWPQIKEDVFRTPLGYLAISVIVGNGVQVIITTLLVISFATLGTISPANPGSISMTILIGYVTLGSCPAGYTTAKLYKMWGGEHWKLTTALTATLLPAMAIFQLLLCNIIFVVTGSSSVLPWTTGIAVLSIWIFGNVPLVFFGGFFAQKQKRVWHPVPPSDIRRFMPSRACYRKIAVLIIKLFCGAIPFSVIFIQLFFILNSLWNNQIYYSYGYLAIQVAILCVLCAEISIVFTYLQLSAENYRWSWNSFITTGFGAVYFFVYCVYFYINKTEAQDPFSFVIYFSYTSLMAIVFLLFTGSIGFIAALVFVRKLYMPYATEYYQKPLNRVVAKELKDVEANVEILETIEQEAEEVNLTAENFKHHQPAEEEEKLLA